MLITELPSSHQVLLSVLAHENKGGHVVRRLQEEIQRVAKTDGAHDVTPVTMALLAGFQFSRAAQVRTYDLVWWF